MSVKDKFAMETRTIMTTTTTTPLLDYRKAKSIYDFTEIDANGNLVPLDHYKGKICVIVNIATKDPICEKIFQLFAKLQRKFNTEDKKSMLSIF